MKFESQLQIVTAAGVPPLTVNQNALVTNFNADLLDGQHASYFLDTSSTAQTKSGNLTLSGLFTQTGEFLAVDACAIVHNSNVESYYQLSRRLQAFSHLGSTTTMEVEVITLGNGDYNGEAKRTTWRISSRGALAVTRHDENGGVSKVSLRILNDTAVPDANGQDAKYVVGLICGNLIDYVMVFMRARFLQDSGTSRWVTIARLATAAPSTSAGSAMTYSSGWIANTGFTNTSFTEIVPAAKFAALTLTGALTGTTGTLSGALTFSAASGTYISTGGGADAFGYNSTAGYGHYIKGTGNTYIYGGGVFFDGSAHRTLVHAGNVSTYALPIGGGTLTGNLTISGSSQLFVGSHMSIQSSASLMGMIGFNRRVSDGAIFNSSYGAYQLQNDTGTLNLQVYTSAGTFVGAHTFNSSGAVSLFGTLNAAGAITQNGNQVLHAGNYTSYSPSLTGSGASGSWGIAITGKSGALAVNDTRNSVTGPSTGTNQVRADFVANGTDGLSDGGSFHGVLTFQQWVDASGGGTRQLGFTDNDNLWIRGSGTAITSYNAWKLILNSVNYSSYALPLSGGTLTGNLNLSAATLLNMGQQARIQFSYSNLQTVDSGSDRAGWLWNSYYDWSGTPSYKFWSTNSQGAAMLHMAPTQLTFYTKAGPSTANTAFSWDAANVVMHSGNVSTYALPIGGGSLTGALSVSGNITITSGGSQFRGSDGTAALPGYSFNADTDTGIYRSASNTLAFATGGVARATISDAGLLNVFGNSVVNGATGFGNRYLRYSRHHGGAQDLAWKKIADITLGTSLYAACAFQIEVIDASSNFGHQADCKPMTFFAACRRSTGVANVPDDAVVTGPVADYVRVVKTATGVYELQIRQIADWLNHVFIAEVISSGDASVTYVTGTPANGSTTGTAYTPTTAGWTQRFANVSAAGQITSTVATGTAPLVVASTTGVANLNSDLLDGQHASYFENRDITAVGFASGTLTFTRAAGNLTISMDGRYVPLSGGTMTGSLIVQGGNASITASHSGNAAQWYGKVATINGTSDEQVFLGTYGNIGAIACVINSTGAWNDLYINTVDGSTGGTVRMPSSVLINGNQALHNGTTSAPNLSIGGNAATASSATRLTNLTSTTTSSAGTDNSESCISYINGISLFGQTDGALYSHVYSANWKHNIYGDYRTGQLAVRGKNNGTWTAWRQVLDSSNVGSYALPIGGGTISGNLTITGTLTEGGYLAFPERVYTVDLTAQSAANFYPIVINGAPGSDNWHHRFSLEMPSLGGAVAYNMDHFHGEARGQGWSDQTNFYRIFHNCYDNNERSVLGLWRGTQSWYGIVLYVRGGQTYYVRTTSRSVTGFTAATTQGDATFAIKNAAGADVSGTSANIGEMFNAINTPQGFHSSYNNYIGGTQVVTNTGTWGISISGTAATATSANALNAANNYQVNSIGVGMAGSGTAGQISLNQLGTRSWTITPSGGNLNFASGDGNGAANFSVALQQGGNQVLHAGNYTSYAAGLGTYNTLTNVNQFRSNVGNGIYLGASNTPPLQAFSNDGGAAFMSFHRSGSYAVNMGLDPDNVLRIGGWSASANRWQLDMSGNQTLAGNITAVGGFFSGNVGAGTSSPYGRMDLGADTGRKLFIYGQGGNVGYITGLGVDLSGSSALSFFTGIGRFEWVKGVGNYPYSSYTVQMTLDGSSNLAVTGSVTASSFSGAGTGLTGTASSLTAGTATNATQLGGNAAANFVQGQGSRGRSTSRQNGTASNLTDPSGFYYGANVTGMPTTDWWHWIQSIGNDWSSPDGYGYQLACSYWSDDLRLRRLTSGTWGSWVQLIHSGNYTSYPPARWATGRTISLTGDVTGTSGSFDGTANLSFAATIANDTVTNAKLKTMAAGTIKGNNGGTANSPSDLTAAQVATMLSGQTMNIAGSSTSCTGNSATATNSTQLNGQAASYYENRDTTAVSISAGTLTLTRAAGNLTTTIGGRVVAWCDFNGNFASSQTPNANFNVSSITKNATGDYTVNFSSALANSNYVVAGTAQLDTPSPGQSNYNVMVAVPRRSGAKATGSCRIVCEYPLGVALYDSISVGVAFIAA